ncbi:hypothetical protein PMAYCL1PPCAC_20764, partial [Pristionchus mayeri]
VLVLIPLFSSDLVSEQLIRACTSFFKRTRTTGRKYPCKGGDHKCEIVKDGKLSCRSCRFDKCMSVGMVYEGPMRIRRKQTILQRIKRESRAFIERRREQELMIIKKHGCHKRYLHPTQEIYDVHQDTYMELYRIFIAESYDFFNNAFPAYSELEPKEKEFIFKDYVAKMSLIECCYRTKQIWGGTGKYMMCSVLTCYDTERAHLIKEVDRKENADFMMSSSEDYVAHQNAIFMPLFSRCKISDQEYHALLCLIMGEIDSEIEISERAQNILDQYRQEILDDLQLHYRNELGLNDYAERLGNLMSLSHVIQECRAVFKVFFRFYATIFD